MLSAPAEKAIEDALRVGKAVLKFLAENDVRRPASHQYGVLLPKRCWRLFTPNAPVKGENKESSTRILWWDGTETDSCVHWYGRKKSEYRLTRFGRESFPHLTSLDTGSLLVLIPESHESFTAYILDLDEDIDGVFEALNVEMLEDWGGFYDRDAIEAVPDNDTCVALRFRAYAQTVGDFPSTAVFSKITRSVVLECDPTFSEQSVDTQILELVRREYDLFKLVELVLCTNEVQGKVFPSVDQFIKTALTILNRRKSRAGRSLENHFADILYSAGIQFDVRAKVQGTPDILIPGTQAYNTADYPEEAIFVVGVKRTCKDRWRQVLQEAPRINRRFLLTLQQGVSAAQFDEMTMANLTLIVPKPYHRFFPASCRSKLLTIEKFLELVRTTQATNT